MKSIYSDIPKIMGICLTIVLVIGSVLPIQAYGSHYLNILGKPLKWNKTYLTFYTPKNLELITDALQIISWRTNNTFTFERVDSPNVADIVYEFNKNPLDLAANGQPALGYTDYESSNRIIHKAMVTLDVRLKPLGVFYTAIHESLHAIGLNHSTEYNSIMNPPYAKYKVITDTDVEHLLLLYLQPKMDDNCDGWLLCYYIEGRINDQWHDKADIKMLEYDNVHGCASWWVTLPTHNIDNWEVHVVFWNDISVVSIAKFNITESQEVRFCTSMETDGAQLGLF